MAAVTIAQLDLNQLLHDAHGHNVLHSRGLPFFKAAPKTGIKRPPSSGSSPPACHAPARHDAVPTLGGNDLNTHRAIPSLLVLALAGSPALAQDSSNPFGVLPPHNPQPLIQLANLSNQQLQHLIQKNGGATLRTILARFDPPDAVVFPISHGFAGSKEACLHQLNVTACRLYIGDLIAMERERQEKASAGNNPFGTTAH
jgi:hypothetical protein